VKRRDAIPSTQDRPLIRIAPKNPVFDLPVIVGMEDVRFSATYADRERKAYYDAENEAVDRINADFYKYAHHVAAHAKGALQTTG